MGCGLEGLADVGFSQDLVVISPCGGWSVPLPRSGRSRAEASGRCVNRIQLRAISEVLLGGFEPESIESIWGCPHDRFRSLDSSLDLSPPETSPLRCRIALLLPEKTALRATPRRPQPQASAGKMVLSDITNTDGFLLGRRFCTSAKILWLEQSEVKGKFGVSPLLVLKARRQLLRGSPAM